MALKGPTKGPERKEASPDTDLDDLERDVDASISRKVVKKLRRASEDQTEFFRGLADDSLARLANFKATAESMDNFADSTFEFDGQPNPLTSDPDAPGAGKSKSKIGVRAIVERLQDVATIDPQMPPEEAVAGLRGRPAGAYLSLKVMTDGRDKENPQRYAQVNADTELILRDREYIEKVALVAYPGNPGLLNLLAALDDLAAVDPVDLASNERALMRKNSPANKAVGYAGKLGATVLLGSMFALTGVMALVTKTPSAAPLFYAGAWLYIVKPDFFKSGDRAKLKEVTQVVGQPKFNEMAASYGMEGDEWEGVFRNIFAMQGNSGSALGQYDKKQITAEQLADELCPGTSSAHDGVLALIQGNDGKDFKALREMLRNKKNKDTQEFLAGYVRTGAWKFAGQVPFREEV